MDRLQADQDADSHFAREPAGLVGPTRYDLVLAVIPLAFLVAATAGVTRHGAVLVCIPAAFVAALLVGAVANVSTSKASRTARHRRWL